MATRVAPFEERILPYFFNTSGKLCAERLSSMILTQLQQCDFKAVANTMGYAGAAGCFHYI